MKRNHCAALLSFLLTILCFLTFTTSSLAAVLTWDAGAGEADVSWHTAANWETDTVPAAGDDVVFPNLGLSYNVDYDPVAQSAPLSLSLVNITMNNSSGRLFINSGTLVFTNSMKVTGSDLLVFGGTLQADGSIDIYSGGKFICSTGSAFELINPMEVQDGGRFITLGGNTIINANTLTVSGSVEFYSGTVTLNGTIAGTGGVVYGSSLYTPGTLTCNNTIISGDFSVLPASAPLPISGTLTVQGAVNFTGAPVFNNFTFNNAGQTSLAPHTSPFNIAAGTGTNAFNNSGYFGSGSTLESISAEINVPFNNKSGGTLRAYPVVFNDILTNDAGATIEGSRIALGGGTLVNNGQLSVGVTELNGDLNSGGTGSLAFLLRGVEPVGGYGHSQLNVSGQAVLDGSLDVTNQNTGYVSAAGDTLQIMTFASRTGIFATENLPTLRAGLVWNVAYSDTDVKLEVLSTSPVTWDGGGDALSWSDPLNWNPDGVPGVGDNMVLPVLAAPYEVDLDTSATVNSLRLSPELTFNFNLGGTTPGNAVDQYSQLNATKGITLGDSTLKVTLTNGFIPSLGDTFTLMTSGSRSGSFAVEILPALPAGLSWHVNYGGYNPYYTSSVILKVMPTPTVTWDGGGDGTSWSDAANWSSDTLPVTGDDVLLPDLGGADYSVSFSGTLTIKSLTLKSSARFAVAAGSLLTTTGEVNATAGSWLYGGNMQVDGKLTVLEEAYFYVSGGTLTQNGTMLLGTNCNCFLTGSGIIQVNGTLTVETDSFTLQGGTLQVNNTVDGTGRIIWQRGTVTGNGILNLTDSGHLLVISSSGLAVLSGNLTNQGNIRWGGFADFSWNDATLTNLGNFIFEGSSVDIVDAGGTNLFINSGTVTGSGATKSFGVPFINRGGIIDSKTGGTIGFKSTLTNEEGSTIQGGSTIDVTSAVVTNDGITSPAHPDYSILSGNTTGILTVTGDYPMGSTSVLNIELGGVTPGSHDQLNISGAAALDGTLNVTLVNGFSPAPGDTFEIVTFGSRTGIFATETLPALRVGLFWQPINYSATSVILTVVNTTDDTDKDNIPDYLDNCPYDKNEDQANTDGDNMGDACDTDDDNDGVADGSDVAPLDPRVCTDTDSDFCDDCSANPVSAGSATPWALYTPDTNNDGADTDGDGACDAGDGDLDNDGVGNAADSVPLDPQVCIDTDSDFCDDCSANPVSIGSATPWAQYAPDTNNDGPDTDGEGLCDAGDTDDDNDGVADTSDADPLDPQVCVDTDSDTCDDCSANPVSVGSATPWALYTPDTNNDGADTDGEGLCDAGDTDDDNDGVDDGLDADPVDPQVCEDIDLDTCDDCAANPASTGSATPWAQYTPDTDNDGIDTDGDGICESNFRRLFPWNMFLPALIQNAQ